MSHSAATKITWALVVVATVLGVAAVEVAVLTPGSGVSLAGFLGINAAVCVVLAYLMGFVLIGARRRR